jgi:hypothetical protein
MILKYDKVSKTNGLRLHMTRNMQDILWFFKAEYIITLYLNSVRDLKLLQINESAFYVNWSNIPI